VSKWKDKGFVAAYNRAYKEARRAEIAAKGRAYYQDNKERIEEQKREYNKRTAPSRKAAQDRYFEANKEHLLAKRREWRERNREKLAEGKRKYYLANKAREDARVRQWREANQSLVRGYYKDWFNDDPDHARALASENQNRRRARKKGPGLTLAEWKQTKEIFGHRCAYCGRQPHRLEQEHIHPIVLGGEHSPENVVPACRSCNARKGARTLLGWLAA
jgi:5-methylcytosine-specific restriction endonuclease McrA